MRSFCATVYNKIISGIQLVFYSSVITMVHGPINITFISWLYKTVFLVTAYLRYPFCALKTKLSNEGTFSIFLLTMPFSNNLVIKQQMKRKKIIV